MKPYHIDVLISAILLIAAFWYMRNDNNEMCLNMFIFSGLYSKIASIQIFK